MSDSTENVFGHNSAADEALRMYVERIERLENEKAEKAKEFSEDIKSVKAEAASYGFDVKVINEQLRRRKWERNNNEERVAVLYLYLGVFG